MTTSGKIENAMDTEFSALNSEGNIERALVLLDMASSAVYKSALLAKDESEEGKLLLAHYCGIDLKHNHTVIEAAMVVLNVALKDVRKVFEYLEERN